MSPALEEVQQAINKAAQHVMGCSKGVAQWSEELHRNCDKETASTSGDGGMDRRPSLVSNAPSESSRSDIGMRGGRRGDEERSSTYAVPAQTRNYFTRVSENKEISRLVSLLSTAINSTKKVSNCLIKKTTEILTAITKQHNLVPY